MTTSFFKNSWVVWPGHFCQHQEISKEPLGLMAERKRNENGEQFSMELDYRAVLWAWLKSLILCCLNEKIWCSGYGPQIASQQWLLRWLVKFSSWFLVTKTEAVSLKYLWWGRQLVAVDVWLIKKRVWPWLSGLWLTGSPMIFNSPNILI